MINVNDLANSIIKNNQIKFEFNDELIYDQIIKYQDKTNLLIEDEITIIRNVSRIMAFELFYQPQLRTYFYNIYKKNILISTEPTLKGRLELDIENEAYFVKRIYKRPIEKFNDFTWIVINQ